MRISRIILGLFLLLGTAASAAPIFGTGDPLTDGMLLGGTQNTFDTPGPPGLGTYTSFSDGFVTYSGIGGDIRVDNSYAGSYNTRGTSYLDNNQGAALGWRFDFLNPVESFAFNLGAADVTWTLTAFDSSNVALEAFVLSSPTGPSNAGDYFGLSNTGISYATFTSSTPSDWVFVDNFTYSSTGAAAVPEIDVSSATIPLAMLFVGGCVLTDGRRRGLAEVTA